VADQIADYAASDLVCYFADAPVTLVRRQSEAWEPVLSRAEAEEGLQFERCVGIVHRPQPPQTLTRVREIALSLDDFALAGLAFAVPLYGSAVLSIAVLRGWLSGGEAFDLSRVDEAFQEEQWGIDTEAAERVARLRVEASMVDQWFRGLTA
jgi:chaperone required for assembly of F1-ATPase